MRFTTSFLLLCAAPWLTALAATSNQKNTAPDEPRYEASSNIDWIVVIADVKEVAEGPLNGVHLLVRPESARSSSETIDVYVAPDDFLKDFGCHFAKGDKVQVHGSKIKFRGENTILAKDVRLESTTLYLRDDNGVPYWKKS